MMPHAPRGRLIVVSGPSGAGKTTVIEHLLRRCGLPLVRSVSATTRPPRPGETDGRDYHFLSPLEFQRRRRRGEFLECFDVFRSGVWYGTLLSETAARLDAGQWVLLNIDVQGGRAVMDRYPDALTIFVQPGSMEELRGRLVGRGTESQQALEQRLQQAHSELGLAHRYRYQVVNDDLARAVQQICDILTNQWEIDRNA